ncbi:MAG TPA: mechanosensitive ion channel family protein [Caulobacteraceae bacterium]|jgi:small conductance mechanosensitive channel|nr:mechanosensitive ion channel family protein [Caulobacteraceae bacterium]
MSAKPLAQHAMPHVQLLDPSTLTWAKAADMGGDLLVNIAIATVIVVATVFASRWGAKLVERGLGKLGFTRHDRTLQLFGAGVARWVIILLGFVAVLQRLGVQTTSIIAMLGAASLAIGLALQGALSNVAAGVLILVLRPYHVGDLVEIGGQTGTVRRLDLFTTIICTRDNRRVVIPNAKAMGDTIVNDSTYERRRADIEFEVARDSDIDHVFDALIHTAGTDQRVLTDPAPSASLTAIDDSGLKITLYAWVKPEDWFQAGPALRKAGVEAFRREDIRIPYPVQVGLTPQDLEPHPPKETSRPQVGRA